MKIVLLANYKPDRQESMERFALMLNVEFTNLAVSCIIWYPTSFFGTFFNSTTSGIGKWFGYIDKWVLFPLTLRMRPKKSHTHYHICDHSNSPYLKYLPADRTSITCHDVLAIRGAIGFSDAYCNASFFGKYLQRWILNNLTKARFLAAVSNRTFQQLKELGDASGKTNWRVIYNAFNETFHPVEKKEAVAVLDKAGIKPGTSYVLHVGSALPRKNRKLLLDMIHHAADKWSGSICFAGQPVDQCLMDHAIHLGLEKRIVSVEKPNHQLLVALYSCCDAFVFPSFSEGFGWPVIEAQACGVPVIASNIEPMPEVSGGAALHADPHNAEEFALAFLSLQDEKLKRTLVDRGFENIKRFQQATMIKAYLELHNIVA